MSTQSNSIENAFCSIETALKSLREGKMIILVDNEDRENEGDIVLAAEKVTPEAINFMVQQCGGLVCLAMTESDFTRMDIPLMEMRNNAPNVTPAFGTSFEAAEGVTTGISASDRAHTIKSAIDPRTGPKDIIMPGHVFPLRARKGGVLERQGHTEGSVDLARLAGMQPAAVICEVIKPDGEMARLPDLIKFAKKHNLCLVNMDDLWKYRVRHEQVVTEIASTILPVANLGKFNLRVFNYGIKQQEIIALIAKPEQDKTNCLVRLHSECLTGDVFGSLRCDCGKQLELSLAKIAEEGGILLYLHQEGRGIGLANKIKAYALQDKGMDTIEANQHLGFQPDERDYALCAQTLKALNITKIRLMTNNPEKIAALENNGIQVTERVPLETIPNKNNIHYLITKRDKMGHWLNFHTNKEILANDEQ